MTFKILLVASLMTSLIGTHGAGRQAQGPSSPATAPHAHAADTHKVPPFASNGCTGFREARFFTCCFVHDLAFWAGGTRHDRRQADFTLRRCVGEISNGYFANFAFFLVRLGTIPGAIFYDGWGRAWRGTRKRYAPLTPEQRARVDEEKRRVCESLKLNPATGSYRVDDGREIRPSQARQVCNGEPPT